MRICTISHSHIALRQHFFFREVARQGHDVLMIAPGEWHNQRTQRQEEGSWRLETCRHIGEDNIYTFKFLGAKDLVMDFKPDWIYAQCEPGSMMAAGAFNWSHELGCKKALFTWENISLKGGLNILPEYDVIICGNPEAEALVKPHTQKTALLLQVGIDTDHFKARPDVEREISVGCVGRATPEKGIMHLSLACPTAQMCEWTPYEMLPWLYSQIEVLVAYSLDNLPYWKEQAPNYVVLEAMSTKCKCVISDTPAMKYWLTGAPGVVCVAQRQIVELREGIKKALEMDSSLGEANREWVVERFSNEVVAKQLLGVLSA